MPWRVIYILLGSVVPAGALYSVYSLVPDSFLSADYRDSVGDDALAHGSSLVFRAEFYSMLEAFGLAMILGVIWGWVFARGRAHSDSEAASKKPTWWGFAILVVIATGAIIWWNTSNISLPDIAVSIDVLIGVSLSIVLVAIALFWLASHIAAKPHMLPSLPLGIPTYRLWTLKPNRERRKSL